MSRFKIRIEEADFKMFGGGGGYMVVGGAVATNFNVSTRQKFYGLSVAFRGLLVAIPCPNFCLSITTIQLIKHVKS